MSKRISSVVVIVVAIVTSLNAQSQIKKGEKLLNIGFGVNSYYNGGIPLSAILEVGVTPQITVGGGIDYLSYDYGYNYSTRRSFTALYIGARGSYHFNELLKINDNRFDVYGGLSLGYRSFSWSDNYNNSYYGLDSNYGSGIFLGIHIGGRYYFTDHIGGFLELGGLGSTNARIGVTFKF
ncbi:MAG: hypothetical protein HOP30_11765 [Cyclobacteriaceae bacterium]|nr:hypothetical protein [Cyclobacteriaceae bacterium]